MKYLPPCGHDIEAIYADLASIREVARTLGVPRSRVKHWIERRASTGCPKPVRKVDQFNIYSLHDWKGWYALWKVTRGCETWKPSRLDKKPSQRRFDGLG